MNERIKELYNKAWLKVDPSNPQETFTNAFAELIVQECIDNVKVWEKDSRNHISYLLKQHFGVKE